jgi:hypothetical protein
MRQLYLLLLLLLSLSIPAFADDNINVSLPLNMQHPFYVGLISGYGNTDWGKVVAQDYDASYATPTAASGSGAIIGGLAGYQVTQYVAIEGQYIHYADSTVTLNPKAVTFGLYPPGTTTPFNSATNYYAIMSKFSAPFDKNHFEAFGTLGAAIVTRSDELAHIHDCRPTFGFGLTDVESEHWNFTLAFNYTPGTGVAAERAIQDYIPYIYAGEFMVTYRI